MLVSKANHGFGKDVIYIQKSEKEPYQKQKILENFLYVIMEKGVKLS